MESTTKVEKLRRALDSNKASSVAALLKRTGYETREALTSAISRLERKEGYNVARGRTVNGDITYQAA